MSALTTAELTAMRADINNLLPDTCNLLTATRASDGQGGYTDTWGTASAGVSCRLDPYRGHQVVMGESLQAFHGWILTLPWDTTITTAYRVEMDSKTYAVTSVDPEKSWKVSVRAYVELV